MLEFYHFSHSTPRGKQIISVYFFQDKTISNSAANCRCSTPCSSLSSLIFFPE